MNLRIYLSQSLLRWILASTVIVLAGCGVQSSFNASVTLNEKEVNNLLVKTDSQIKVNGQNLINKLESVDFVSPNMIQMKGIFNLPAGGTTPGTIDFAVGSENGAIALKIANVNAKGLSLDTPVIRTLNDQFAKALFQEVQDGNSKTVSTVTVMDDKLNVSIAGKPAQ